MLLFEVLVALAIFGVGILGVFAAVQSHFRAGEDARYRIEAAAAADELATRLLTAAPATRVADFSTGGTGFNAWLNGRLKASGTGLPGAAATVTFNAVAADPRTVAIEIRWTPPREAVRDATGAMTAVSTTHRYRTVLALVR